MRDLFALSLDWYSDHHVDLDLLSEFVSAPDVARWWHAWGANTADAVPDFLLFARDGTGGQLGIWRRDPSAALEREPVVFFGSAGELAVLASSVLEFVALLANGLGPIEVVYPGDKPQPIAAVEQLWRAHGGKGPLPDPVTIVSGAREVLPVLRALVDAAVR